MTRRVMTRVSTLAKTLDDASSLFAWKQEMVVRGISAGADLQALLATMDPDGPKERFREIAKQAEDRAASSASANLGTAIHSAIGILVSGGSVAGLPEATRRDAEAVVREIDTAGLRVLTSECFVVADGLTESVAGSFDHLVRGARGAYVMDVKSMSNAETPRWGALSWATQVACYAHGEPFVGSVTRDRWTRPVIDDIPENFATWPEKPDQSVGIVAAVVRGSGQCELIQVDLALGWRAAQLACDVRAIRKAKALI